MRKYFFRALSGAVCMVLMLAASGCCSSLYDNPENWAAIDSDTPSFYAAFDLIYLYPSQEEENAHGCMNWVYGNVGKEVRSSVRLVISSQFGSRVRVFSPFVPLLSFKDYDAIITEFKKSNRADFDFYDTKLKVPIDYAVEALKVYFSHYHSSGHPMVFYGHEQGALVLYEAMKRVGKVSPDNGFVAGYFFGIPGITRDEIESDFCWRGIHAAVGRDDVGVVVICNIRKPGEPLEHTLATPNGAVINPLNWRADATPADAKQNPESMFLDHKHQNPLQKVKRVVNFCGAVADAENGVVNLTDINMPKNCDFKLEDDCLFSDAWGIFSKSVSLNAEERVSMYKFIKTGVKMPK